MKKKKIKETEEKVSSFKRGANRTKEQREFPEFIVNDYCNLFLEKYMDFFRNFGESYTIENRIDEESWKTIYSFVIEATEIVYSNNYGLIYDKDKLNNLKYLTNPSTLYIVREHERLILIKKFIDEYDIANAIVTTTKIQEWNKNNLRASTLYHIYAHLFLYLTETKK